ncbi:hypothetical protein GY631_0746 [Trichophyton interdigitale]|uniref:Uncharacterized protein n=1 Tax=Trichophyton interdigitale TaxID=101480 RepID=A0A9P4YIN1_9EURO|nr:hypothetical protein GY632_1508 [Trichophyton interdigitale]KAF3899160.1 hypothetical protein GY631_0746 [Trichophyton interdigitale]
MANGSKTPSREGSSSESPRCKVKPLNWRKKKSPRDKKKSKDKPTISAPIMVVDAGLTAQQTRGIPPIPPATDNELPNHQTLRSSDHSNVPASREAETLTQAPWHYPEPLYSRDEPSSAGHPIPVRTRDHPQVYGGESYENTCDPNSEVYHAPNNNSASSSESWDNCSEYYETIPATPLPVPVTIHRRMPVNVDTGREPRLAVNIVQNNRNESSQASRAVQNPHELESRESSPVRDYQRMEVVYIHTDPFIFLEIGATSALLALVVAYFIYFFT